MAPAEQDLRELLERSSRLRPRRPVTVRGARADAYVELLVRLWQHARPDRHFPDRRRLAALLGFLAPRGSHHTRQALDLGADNGLPVEAAVTAVQADRAVAPEVVGATEVRRPAVAAEAVARSRPLDEEELRRYRYHRALLAADVLPSFELAVALRRPDDGAGRLELEAVLTRYDLALGTWVRYRALLACRPRREIALEGDRLRVRPAFGAELASALQGDAEIAFLLLAAVDGVRAESVRRGEVGPLAMAGLEGAGALQELVERRLGAVVLQLPREHAGLDVARDLDHDPFAFGWRRALQEEARALVEERRRQLGYRVYRERKLVSTPGLGPELERLTALHGARCVVDTLA